MQKLHVSSKLLDFGVPNLYRSTRVSICAAKTLQPGKHLQPAVRRCIGPTANEARTANRPTFTAQLDSICSMKFCSDQKVQGIPGMECLYYTITIRNICNIDVCQITICLQLQFIEYMHILWVVAISFFFLLHYHTWVLVCFPKTSCSARCWASQRHASHETGKDQAGGQWPGFIIAKSYEWKQDK